jgi:hypothetical protein
MDCSRAPAVDSELAVATGSNKKEHSKKQAITGSIRMGIPPLWSEECHAW